MSSPEAATMASFLQKNLSAQISCRTLLGERPAADEAIKSTRRDVRGCDGRKLATSRILARQSKAAACAFNAVGGTAEVVPEDSASEQTAVAMLPLFRKTPPIDLV
jgi:hypothetical protein